MKTSPPEDVGLSSTTLNRIHKVMQGYVDQNKLAGLITMLARRGRVAHFERFGMMDIEANKPMQLDTIFRIRSMTKPITAVAVMMLYEEGHFQLYDPLSEFIPAFKGGQVYAGTTEARIELADLEREISIRHLLTHTSGLDSGFGQDQPLAAMYAELQADLFGAPKTGAGSTLQERVQKLAKIPLLHLPGRAWRYGWSYEVLAHLVEVISGISFDAFLQQRIFEPLGMVDTGFYVPQGKRERFAVLYGAAEQGGLQIIEGPSQNWRTRYPISGSTGLVSTASDYMRFAQMLLDGGELDGQRLLGRKTVEFMTVNQLPAELLPIAVIPEHIMNGYGYGFGVSVLMKVPPSEVLSSKGSFGWPGYATTHFWVDPRQELVGLIMAQFAPLGYYPVYDQFRVLCYQAIVD
jgi:CubicO group peptidase (beta-lactamase class C family)